MMWRSLLLLLVLPLTAQAQGFSALVSPPRFEGKAAAGTTYREVVEITNASNAASHFSVHTADWGLDASGAAVFSEGLKPDSCRPWVGVEAREITLSPRGKRRYRFEVNVPADAPAQECRFAIMIEGDPQAVPGAVALPVSGRLGVIVYLAVAGAKPQLVLEGTATKTIEGRRVPAVRVRNTGTAHTRLEGFGTMIDAKGVKWTVMPESMPILAGEARTVALQPQDEGDQKAPAQVAFPVKVNGTFDWSNQRLPVEATIAP